MPQPLRFGICTDQNMTWPVTVERWRYLEALDFDSIWVCDHLIQPSNPANPYFEGSTLLAGLAAVTKRARIGVLVWSNTFRHPSVLAKESITIDHISNGRLEVGIGAGWYVPEHQKFGLEYLPDGHRVSQFREATQIIDSLLRNETTSFQGTYYQLDDAPTNPRPLQQPRPPITIGAKKTRMLRIAAEYAERWNASGSVEEMRERNVILDQHCADLGRDPDSIIRSLYGWASVMSADPWESVDAFEQVIGEYREAGVNEFIIDQPPAHQMDVMERVATDVIPRMRAS
ncbi:MAG TPA: LLM class flavin-dependent oxidoreductase [Thermomicrobiales bacterium]|nr:LLM class flavin-dependent oxidoreductase [Thermomicrobiales bacterium]